MSIQFLFHDVDELKHCFTLMNFLPGSGLLSVIFMMTPLVN